MHRPIPLKATHLKATRYLNSIVLLGVSPILSGAPSALAAPQDANPPGEGRAEFTISASEILLDGKIHVPNPAQRTCLLDVTGFTLPNGKSSRLSQAKTKTIVVDEQTLLYVRGDRKRLVPLTSLKNPALAIVIGKDLGSGKSLPAREIVVWEQVQNGSYLFRRPTNAANSSTPNTTGSTPPVSLPDQDGLPTQNPLPQIIPPATQHPTTQSPTSITAPAPTTRIPGNTAPATGAVPAPSLTWENGPILEVQIRTTTPQNNSAAGRLSPGATSPPTVASVTRPTRIFRTILKSPEASPEGATASLTMPPGLKRESPGRLNITKPRELPSGMMRPLQMQLYWGSGDKVPAGQPRMLQAPGVVMGYYSRVGRPPEKLADIPSVAIGPLRMQPGLPGAGATLPGLPGAEPPVDNIMPSSVGAYTLTTSYVGNATFQISPEQDFLEAITLTLPTTKPDLSQPLTVSWNAIPGALGYRVLATGTRRNLDRPGITAIMWTSSQVPPEDVEQMESIYDPAQALKDGRLLPTTTTSCTVPTGVLNGMTSVTFLIEAIGPVQVVPGKPAVRIATTADVVSTLNIADGEAQIGLIP